MSLLDVPAVRDLVNEVLGARAVKCRGWTWLPGTRSIGSLWRMPDWTYPDGSSHQPIISPHCLPDFSDAATRGCLLELVRAAYFDPDLHVDVAATGTRHVQRRGRDCDRGPETIMLRAWVCVGSGVTDAEALIVALEGAP